MRSRFEQRVFQSIQNASVIVPGIRLGVAVSGGADSVALLRLLHRLRNELGISLTVAHLNHSLRGAESEADAKFVEHLAQEMNLPFVLQVQDVAGDAKRERWNLEDAGRRARQQFFEGLVKDNVVDRVAVAHTADDQAETVLARLMRGTGLTGLGGIYPEAGPVVRPLIEVRRAGLRDYLRTLQQDWREDSTNSDVSRMRARIRKGLLPLIENEFSPTVVEHLSDLARLAREEETFWEALVDDRFCGLARADENGVHIAAKDLEFPLDFAKTPATAGRFLGALNTSRALSERLARRMYGAVRGDLRELSATHVEQIIHLATAAKAGSQIEIPGGICVRRDLDEIVFLAPRKASAGQGPRETFGKAAAYQYSVELPLKGTATMSVAEVGKRLCLNLIDWPSAERDTIRDSQALDADLLQSPLILRNWRPGDSYRPRGRRDGRKLKHLLLADRVPASQRGGWPVLESAGNVVWALGMAPAAECAAQPTTRRALIIYEAVLDNVAGTS